ncbi:MAG: cation diffusion facilitator family transporter [Geminicoccaceae bacterium]
MAHDHAHGHSHAHGHGPGTHDRAFAIGVGLNLAFVLVEATAGFWAGSLALIADAGHNLTDVGALALAWGAAVLGRRPPTARRTYGYRRASVLASLVNAVALLIGVGAILLEAIRRLQDPAPVEAGVVGVVAAIGIAINAGTAMLFARGREHDLNVRGAYLHMAADAAVSLGVVLAAVLIATTGWLWLDPVTSIAICLAITVSGWGLLTESLDLALDAVPAGIDRSAVETMLGDLPGVREVHDLHIWAMSTTETALTAHLVRPDPTEDDFLTDACAALHDRFGIEHVTLQIERGTAHCRQAPAEVV